MACTEHVRRSIRPVVKLTQHIFIRLSIWNRHHRSVDTDRGLVRTGRNVCMYMAVLADRRICLDMVLSLKIAFLLWKYKSIKMFNKKMLFCKDVNAALCKVYVLSSFDFNVSLMSYRVCEGYLGFLLITFLTFKFKTASDTIDIRHAEKCFLA